MADDEKMAVHVSTVEEMAKKLEDLGEPLSEKQIITKLISSLPEKYRYFESAWDSVAKDGQTRTNLIARLFKEESTRETKGEPSEAFVARTKSVTPFSKGSSVCNYCKKPGHWIKDCRKRLRKTPNKLATVKSSSAQMCMDESASALVTLLGRNQSDLWLTDSGASRHMCNTREVFSSFTKFAPESYPVNVADNGTMFAEGIGRIKINSYVDNKVLSHVLHDVLYVPDLSTNLFSVGAADEKGATAVFENGRVLIKRNDDTIITGVKIDDSRLYKLNISCVIPDDANLSVCSSLELLHKKLGHISIHTLKKSGLLTKLGIKDSSSEGYLLICDSHVSFFIQSMIDLMQ